MFCEYRDIFGKVGEGAHKYRILDIAIVDVIMTVVLAYVIQIINPQYKFINIIIILFVFGIVVHRLFCVRTTIDKLLFPSHNMEKKHKKVRWK